jgi:hypothetical protein
VVDLCELDNEPLISIKRQGICCLDIEKYQVSGFIFSVGGKRVNSL